MGGEQEKIGSSFDSSCHFTNFEYLDFLDVVVSVSAENQEYKKGNGFQNLLTTFLSKGEATCRSFNFRSVARIKKAERACSSVLVGVSSRSHLKMHQRSAGICPGDA